MRNPAQFLENSLEENGLMVDSVTHERNDVRQCDTFTVAKEFGGERHYYNLDITDEALVQNSEEKTYALHAQEIADAFREKMVERIQFGRRSIDLCPYEGGWAECNRCGSRVDLIDEVIPKARFEQDAELSVPTPRPRDPEKFTEQLSEENEARLKVYLLGLLRKECDRRCPNSRYHDEYAR
jgi:hypothetical protein